MYINFPQPQRLKAFSVLLFHYTSIQQWACVYDNIFLGCIDTDLPGDGYCDDETNIGECNYDGGDCCGPNIVTKFCTDCQCLEQKMMSCYVLLIGDGYCDDSNNELSCNFDGGDCCGSNVKKDYCNDCECLEPRISELDCLVILFIKQN